MRTLPSVMTMLILLSIALIVSACILPAKGAVTSITIKGGDYNFAAPAQVPAGLVSIRFENVGHEAHHVQLVQLNDGVTMDQVLAAFPQGDAAVFPLLKSIDGGVGPIEPGASGRVTVKLAPGNYVLLCLLPSHDGVPHLAKGMVAPLTVTGQTPDHQPEPAADGTVTLVDFSFALPQAIKAGEQTWKITNQGTQPHEIALVKLGSGKTMADLMAFDAAAHSTPPFTNVGGFQGLTPGASGWLHLNLTPGDYVAICHIPDAASGKAHSELGMMLPFTVH